MGVLNLGVLNIARVHLYRALLAERNRRRCKSVLPEAGVTTFHPLKVYFRIASEPGWYSRSVRICEVIIKLNVSVVAQATRGQSWVILCSAFCFFCAECYG